MTTPGGPGSGNGGSHFTTPKRSGRRTARHQKAAPVEVSPAEQLRVRREALGLSRARLADETELPVSQIWRAEHEDAGVDDETRTTIVGVLNRYREHIANLPPLS